MDFDGLVKTWDKLGEQDPLWSILTDPNKKGGKWDVDEFFQTGVNQIDLIMNDPIFVSLNRETCLDFGCGVGRLSQAFVKYFEKVYAVDVSEHMLNLANKYNKHGDRCKYILNNSDTLEIFQDCFFDFVFSFLVLQHMEPKYSLTYVEEFMRILKVGGWLVFQIPSAWKKGFCSLIGQKYNKKTNHMEMYYVSKEEIIRIIEKNGGYIERIEEYNSNGEDFMDCIYYVRKIKHYNILKFLVKQDVKRI